ncbi:TPA: hypothetical protein ACGPBJ_000018 [Streptococcus suis]|nr:hypothetical protein [Streptococcus suis]
MRGPNHPMFYWKKNKDWYRVVDKVRYELTEKATQQAKESFELYKNELELRKKGIYA